MSKLHKSVWITGASTGIGRALAKEFAGSGEHVIATSRRKDVIANYAKELDDKSENILPMTLDVTDLKSMQEFYDSVSKKYNISCLINNAGLTSFNEAEKDSLETIQKIIETNLLGSIFAMKTVLPDMQKNKNGTVINMLSVVTKKVFTGSSAYSATKSGLLAYSNALREEVRKDNIRIINVIPGATQTPIWPNSTLEKKSYRMMSPAELAKLIYGLYSVKSNMVAEEIVLRPIQGDL